MNDAEFRAIVDDARRARRIELSTGYAALVVAFALGCLLLWLSHQPMPQV